VEDRKQDELAYYDQLYSSGQYNSDPSLRESVLRESEETFLKALRSSAAGKRVLEIGCGTASHSMEAARGGAHVVASDISMVALKCASAACSAGNNPPVFLRADAEALPFRDESFDVVLEHEALSSVDPIRVIPELARVLAPGGIVIGLEAYGHNPLMNLNRRLNVLRGRRTKWAASHIVQKKHLELARRCFAEVEVRYFHFLSPFSAPLRRLLPRSLYQRFLRWAEGVDRRLLSLPWLQSAAFKVFFIMRK
jgi:ubiquinone/menaquinone biosynthesis C-methylase UbiE